MHYPGGGTDTFLPPIETRPHRYITREEWDRLIGKADKATYTDGVKAAPEWLVPILTIGVTYGLRLGEIVTLQWPDVDLETGNLNTDTKTKTGFRVVKLPAGAVASFKAMHRFGQLAGHVFRQPDTGRPNAGKAWNYASARTRLCKAVTKAMREAEIESASYHTLRHTCASWMVQNGASLQMVERATRTRVLRDDARYAHRDESARAKAATAMAKALA